MSVATHSIHAFLPLPFLMFLSTSKFLHLETQSSAALRSTCPYHLNLPRLTTLSTLSIPNPCQKAALAILSRVLIYSSASGRQSVSICTCLCISSFFTSIFPHKSAG